MFCQPKLCAPIGREQILINRDAVAPPRSTSDGFDVSLIGVCVHFNSILTDGLPFFEFSLCLSRGCLGKKICF